LFPAEVVSFIYLPNFAIHPLAVADTRRLVGDFQRESQIPN
jgi:hypothetical protein